MPMGELMFTFHHQLFVRARIVQIVELHIDLVDKEWIKLKTRKH